MQCTLDNCSSWLSSTLRVKLTLLHFARAHWLIRMSGRQHVYTYQHLKRASRCWQHDLVRTVNLLFIKGCIVYTLNNRRVTSVQESAVTPVVQITQISEHRSIIYCCARRGAMNFFICSHGNGCHQDSFRSQNVSLQCDCQTLESIALYIGVFETLNRGSKYDDVLVCGLKGC